MKMLEFKDGACTASANLKLAAREILTMERACNRLAEELAALHYGFDDPEKNLPKNNKTTQEKIERALAFAGYSLNCE